MGVGIALGNSAKLLGLGRDFSVEETIWVKVIEERKTRLLVVLLLADWVILGQTFNVINHRIPLVKQIYLPLLFHKVLWLT